MHFSWSITTKPSFYKRQQHNPIWYKRAVITHHIITTDEMMGIGDRKHFQPDSHDAYRVMVVSETSKADCENIIKALKKVCAQYSPTTEENIIQWEEGKWNFLTNQRFEYDFLVIVRKSGIQYYT